MHKLADSFRLGLASFVREMQPATHAESEERFERLHQAHEPQKPHLIFSLAID